MSCPNNCNPGCNCNNCCPPPNPPVDPPTPPICEGEECSEIYDAKCITYTGLNINCLNILNGDNLNTIVQKLAEQICECCGVGKCKHPLELLFERVLYRYNSLNANSSVSITSLLTDILDDSIITKKCQYCCPDNEAYGLFFSEDMKNAFEAVLFTSQAANGDDIINSCLNNGKNFTQCSAELLTSFDSESIDITQETIFEYSSINGISAICNILNLIKDYGDDFIKEVMSVIQEHGLIIACDLENGNIFIGSLSTFQTYFQKVMVNS